MHPIVNLKAAEAGALESPAYARRGLTPKVPIGTMYQAPKRDTISTDRSYHGYGRVLDADASLIQSALLRKNNAPRPAKKDGSIWWWVSGAAAFITLCYMAVFVGPAVF